MNTPKEVIIGGREYLVIKSTTEMELSGRVVSQSFTVVGGSFCLRGGGLVETDSDVTIENGEVTHPDGTRTDLYGRLLDTENNKTPLPEYIALLLANTRQATPEDIERLEKVGAEIARTTEARKK